MVRVGDIVSRKSYGCDILFRVKELNKEDMAVLRGITTRLEATAPVHDLVHVSKEDQARFASEHAAIARQRVSRLQRGMTVQRERALRANHAESVVSKGRIVHLDGDADYVVECQQFYNSLNATVHCVYVPEAEQKDRVEGLCRAFMADVVVLTGHDGKIKNPGNLDGLKYYHNSEAFLRAVQVVRSMRPDRDDLAVVAGACQSYFEALLEGGANYASSPNRILIDIFDPCIVAVQIAALGVKDFLQPEGAVKATVGQGQGMGGVETKGKARVQYPAATKGEGDA